MNRDRIKLLFISAVMIAASLSGCSRKIEEEQPLPEVTMGVNVVVNPSFEEWDGFMPVGWSVKQFAGEGRNTNMYGKSTESKTGEFSYYLRGMYNTDRWMVLYQTHPVRPGCQVEFSADISTKHLKKDEGQESRTSVYLIFYDREGKRVSDRYFADAWTKEKRGTRTWKNEAEKITAPENAVSVEIGLINQLSGYVYFDDVSLVIKEGLDWQTRDTKFIRFCWLPERPFPEEDIEREAAMIEEIAKEAGIKSIEGKICHRMYPSEEAFIRINDLKKYSQAADWKKKELHTVLSFEDHDMVHMILYGLGIPPYGMAKGLVFYFRAKYHGWDLHNAAKQDLLRQQLPALYRTIKDEAFKESDFSVTVPGWGSFSKYMIDTYGMDKFLKLYKSLNEVKEPSSFNAHFREVYERNFDEVDREWRWFLLRYECDAAADTIL